MANPTELRPSKAPNIPLAPQAYDARSQEQFHNALRLYFATIDNYLSQLRADPAHIYSVQTTDATTTTLATITIPSETTVLIEAHVVARRTGGVSGTAEDGAAYVIDAAYKNVAGTATEIGETAVFTAEDQAGWSCTLSASGGDALLRVTGAVGNNVVWNVRYYLYTAHT